MTHTVAAAQPALATATGAPAAPLKADRVQLVVVVVAPRNRPYDFANETTAERNARLDAGWRKHTVDAAWRRPHAA
jgi:hypothetical protein